LVTWEAHSRGPKDDEEEEPGGRAREVVKSSDLYKVYAD